MKKITFIILSFLLPLFAYSQLKEYELDEIFLDADSWLFYEEFQDALPLFMQVYEVHPENSNLNYKIGLCYLNIEGKKHNSIPYFEKAISNTTNNYRKNTYAEKKAPLDAYFYLGNAYLINNQIKKAQDTYNKFETKITETKNIFNKDSYNFDFLQKQKQSCETAIKLKQNPINFIATNIGSPINTQFSDLNAVISADGNSIIFTSELKFYNAIFYSTKEDGKWNYPINLMGQLKVDDSTFPTSLSKDGTELYLYRKDDFDGNIYISRLTNGIWSQIEKLGPNINTKYWESHATISPNGKELYFVSNRAGGKGDLDIYVAQKLDDGTWGNIKNLDKNINTQWNENTPFLSNDGNTLFFSSEGHNTMGGYDIFYSHKINNTWQEPKNIGYPINTTDNNSFFVPTENAESAYFSFFSSKGYGKRDIFKIHLSDINKPSNIKVEGIAKYDDEIHNKKQDFTIIIIDTLLHDTIAILSPEKELSYNEYKTPNGKNHLLFESNINSDGTNQILISQNYKIKNVFLNPIELKETNTLTDSESPEINIDKREYYTQSGNQKIKIKLSLQKGSLLLVNTFMNDKLLNSEKFNVKNEDFIYEYKPIKGNSNIKFKLIGKNNKIQTQEVFVSCISPDIDSIAEIDITEKTYTLKDGQNNIKIKLSVEKNSKLFVKTYVNDKLINSEKFKITKDNFTYEFTHRESNSKINFKLVDKHNNFKSKEITITNKPLEKELAGVLNNINRFKKTNISNILNSFINKSEIKSSEDLLKLLFNIAETNKLSPYIIAIALQSGENALQFKNELVKLSNGNIKQTLAKLNNDTLKNQNSEFILNYLISESNSSNYSKKDILNLISKYVISKYKNPDNLLSELNKYASFDIHSILDNIDESALAITSVQDFSNYFICCDKFSNKDKEIICSMINGINISLLIQKENTQEIITNDNKPNETKATNKYLVLFIITSFLALIFIFIYIKKKKH